ncbi:hypothetical protein HII13_004633 [Brettanomyces bruxellensis]|nr:hypothetical protein HII13_004633 [Brettanomyces bruxellensis]
MTMEADPLDTFVTKVSAESLDYQTRHSLFSELRDTLESFHGSSEYSRFLNKTIDIFFKELDTVPISFVSNSPEQKLRYLILEILHRLPLNETLEPYAERLLLKLSKIIREDNEENGILCLKLITSLHKAYKAKVENHVPDFVDFLEAVYKEMPKVVEEQFGSLKKGTDHKTKEEANSKVGDASEETNAKVGAASEETNEKLTVKKEEEQMEAKADKESDDKALEEKTEDKDNKMKKEEDEVSGDDEKLKAKTDTDAKADNSTEENAEEKALQ